MQILEGNLIAFDIDSLENLNLSESEYITKYMGDKYRPMSFLLPITFAYMTIFVTGIIGNILTCIIMRKLSTTQTPTNYYLFNLAVSDLLLLILGVPNELMIFWEKYPWTLGLSICKLRAYVSETYLAICHPFQLYAKSGMKRPVRFIVSAWLLALVCALPFGIYTTVNYLEYPAQSGRPSEKSAFCAMLLHSIPVFPLYELSCFMFFLVPMVYIAVVYVKISLRIRRNNLKHNNVNSSVHGDRHAQTRKAVRLLSAVVIAFFMCWAPFHIQRILYVYQIPLLEEIDEWLFPIAGLLYYFSCTVNPILYCIMSKKYRTEFKRILGCSEIPINMETHL
ncbi:neuropeptides capa receptor-like isoform X2 [Pseudomyrmex gracilis]|uniref:neuropeptides capa receptor-like isoform X2 n=1 Tax=Pseudomyrmex gracilis TaxID=219809 RepID=UPI000994DDFE|nr:neuropeptides capa receptor-like isoform X2 [Pseudomyrmex gracilis]